MKLEELNCWMSDETIYNSKTGTGSNFQKISQPYEMYSLETTLLAPLGTQLHTWAHRASGGASIFAMWENGNMSVKRGVSKSVHFYVSESFENCEPPLN